MSPQERGAHTPGEWRAFVMTREITVEAPCGRILFTSGNTGDETEIADAFVIAASKDLLFAAQQIIDVEQTVVGSPEQGTYSERYRAAMMALRVAIAKATGTRP